MLRRTFLSSLAGIPLLGAPRRVVVAGAGLAGMAAAWELRRRGVEAVVVEASPRAGGRVRTLREPFAPGLYAEAGAVRVASHHARVRGYAKEFGLGFEPFLPAGKKPVYVLNGRRVVEHAGARVDWPVELKPEEQGRTLDEIYERAVLPALEKYAKADRRNWPPPGLREFDGMTQPEFWARLGVSEGARRLLALGYRLEEASALWGILEELDLMESRGFERIQGGNDRLPAAFARRLAGQIEYGTALRAVRQDAAGVEVTVERAGRRETMRGEALICALPLTTLRDVEFTPALGEARRRLIAEIPYMAVSRVYLQVRRRVWLEEGLSGAAMTDLPSHRFWPSAGGAGRGILHSYTWDREARELDAMAHGERVKRTLADAETAFPGVSREVEGTAFWSWQAQEWQRGGFAAFRPGQVTPALELLPRREGRVAFAGAHLWSSVSWMEGALATAQRAVGEVMAGVRD